MSKAETAIQNRVWKAAARMGWTLFRNNVGVAVFPDSVVRYGLCPGSADLVGIRPVTITEDMVGTQIGQFVAVEVKTGTGTVSPEQKKWLERMKALGAHVIVARKESDLEQ